MEQPNTCVCSFNLNQVCRCYTLLSIAAHLSFASFLIVYAYGYNSFRPEMVIGAIFLSMGLINIAGLYGMEKKKVAVMEFYLLAQRIFALAIFATTIYFYMMTALNLSVEQNVASRGKYVLVSSMAIVGTFSFPLHLYFGVHIPNRFCVFIDDKLKDKKELDREIDIDETFEMTVLEKGYCAMA